MPAAVPTVATTDRAIPAAGTTSWEVVVTSQDDETDPRQSVSAQVIVGVDGSRGSDTAVRWAAGYAAGHGRELLIVHGMGLVGDSALTGPYAVWQQDVIDAARTRGAAVVEQAEQLARRTAPDVRVATLTAGESPATLLVYHSAGAYAVVLGSTGSAGTLEHLGSTLLAVTAHSHGAVIVVPDGYSEADRAGGPVVVGIDGSPVSEPAIAAAFAEAAERDTELVAVHAYSDWDFGQFAGMVAPLPDAATEAETAILAERLAGWQEKYPDVPIVRQTYLSAPGQRLREWSNTAQLLVVGSRGRGGFRGLLFGSTSNYLVQHAYCPVMVVHEAEK
ncbi:universal stress protein [Nocardia sp. NEAU-G5]|uniref:Universal stress protein n=1 Tax=Nocardia albiluteola TaxID=2842303 RepID=A0ABS6AWW3_9NOCA|nr:universal stress protein [Nocardia albiluteola]